MKKLLILAASLAAFTSAKAEVIEASISIDVESAYVFRGVQLAENAVMPSFDVSYGDTYFGVWAALPTTTNYADEIDLYVGHGIDINETISLDFGGTLYTYPSSGGTLLEFTDDTLELYAGFTFDAVFSPSVYLYYDLDLEATTLQFDIASDSYELTDTGLSFDWGAFAGYVTVSGAEDYAYYGASVSFSQALSETFSVALGGYASGASESMMFGNNSAKVWYGLSVTAGM